MGLSAKGELFDDLFCRPSTVDEALTTEPGRRTPEQVSRTPDQTTPLTRYCCVYALWVSLSSVQAHAVGWPSYTRHALSQPYVALTGNMVVLSRRARAVGTQSWSSRRRGGFVFRLCPRGKQWFLRSKHLPQRVVGLLRL